MEDFFIKSRGCIGLEFGNVWLVKYLVKLHSHQTADQPRPMPTNFYGLVGYDRVKNYPLWLKSVSILDQHPLYPWCTHAQIPLFPTYPCPSVWPIPALHDQPRPIPDATTFTTLNIGPTPYLYAWFPLLASNEEMPTDSLMRV